MPNKGVPPGIPLPPGPDLLYNTVEIRFFEPSGEKKMLRIIGRFRKTGIRHDISNNLHQLQFIISIVDNSVK